MIALRISSDVYDAKHYLRINNKNVELCIRNISDTTLIVHEICHIDAKCSLCDEDTGKIILMSRTEVQAITSTGLR